MNFRIVFFLFAICISILSCAKKINPIIGYNQIKSRKAINLFEENIVESKKIDFNKDFKSKLTLNDSVLLYLDTISSNYQKYSIVLKPNKKYKIKVSSLCDCAGFKKYMFIPQVFPVNIGKETIKTKPDTTYFNYEKGPLTLNKVWVIQNENLITETEYDFFIFSDNRNLTDKIYKFIGTSVGVSNNFVMPVIVPISIKSSLIGNFYLRVEEE